MADVKETSGSQELPEELQKAIALMKKQPGIYILTIDRDTFAPLWTINGKLYSMKIDREISWDHFMPGAVISGPLLRFLSHE